LRFRFPYCCVALSLSPSQTPTQPLPAFVALLSSTEVVRVSGDGVFKVWGFWVELKVERVGGWGSEM